MLAGVLGHEESLSEQDIFRKVLVTGGIMLNEHHGWLSISSTLMQVSNIKSPNVNGNIHSLHPTGKVNSDQTATNPDCVKLLSGKIY